MMDNVDTWTTEQLGANEEHQAEAAEVAMRNPEQARGRRT